MTWPLILLLGIYIGGAIPILCAPGFDERGEPMPTAARLKAAACWPLIIFGGWYD